MPVSYMPKYTDSTTSKKKKHPMVVDYMTRKLITMKPDMDVYETMNILIKNGISGAPVVAENGEVVGVVSEKDCLKVIEMEHYYEQPSLPLSEFMSSDVHGVEDDTDIYDVMKIFIAKNYRRLPVFQEGKLVGQISRRDCLKALIQHKGQQ